LFVNSVSGLTLDALLVPKEVVLGSRVTIKGLPSSLNIDPLQNRLISIIGSSFRSEIVGQPQEMQIG
jgi:hypothetical protein